MSNARIIWVVAVISILGLTLGPASAPALGQDPQMGFPSLDTNDGKFLALAGTGPSTAAQPVSFWIGLPAGQGSFTLDVFDGDLGGLWDVHDPASSATVNFVLLADPLKNGQGTTLIASKSSAELGDDAWTNIFNGPVHSAARAPSGNHFYRLAVSFADATAAANELNGFKVRVTGQVSIIPGTFGFLGAPINMDVLTGRTDPTPGSARNQYNGEWRWFVYAPSAGAAITLTDTDADSRTSLSRPGNPPDDCSPSATCFAISPDVRYEVLEGSGQVLSVTSPSGDMETVSRTVTASRAGFLDWHWTGLDGHNRMFISSSHEIFSSSAQAPLLVSSPPGPGFPTIDPNPAQSVIRGRVYGDDNCNGVMDGGERGLEGVSVTIDSGWGWTASTLSGSDGEYGFGGLSKGRFSLGAGPAAGYDRSGSQKGIEVDGRVQTVVSGKDLGLARESACVPPAPPPAPPPAAPAAPRQPITWPPREAASTWYMAEGNTGTLFETILSLTNPASEAVQVRVTYFPEGASPLSQTHQIPPAGALHLVPGDDLPGVALGIIVEADRPITAQRTMVFSGVGKHLGTGSPVLDKSWLVSNIDTTGGLQDWVLVLNPHEQPVSLTLSVSQAGGAQSQASFTALPASRLTIFLNSIAPESKGSVTVESDLPVVVEHSTYWDNTRSGFNSLPTPSAALP